MSGVAGALRPLPIVVVGAGGHGRETVSLIRESEARRPGQWELVGVVADEEPDRTMLDSLGVAWLGPVDRLDGLGAAVSIAIGDGSTRSRLQARARQGGARPVTLVHPSCSLGLDVELAEGCFVGALTVMTTHVRLGEGAQVNASCSLAHDVSLGDFATLAPGVHLAGGVVVGSGATVFTGATVLPRVRIGQDAVVGAGAVVTADVAPGSTVVGVPARPLVRSGRTPRPGRR